MNAMARAIALLLALLIAACGAAVEPTDNPSDSSASDAVADSPPAAQDAPPTSDSQTSDISADGVETQPADTADAADPSAADGNSTGDTPAADTAAIADSAIAADSTIADSDTSLAPPSPLQTALTLPLWLKNGAFAQMPTHPSALVYAPKGFDPTQKLQILVYIHGHNNCIQNVLGNLDTSCDPLKKTPIRSASHLADQLTAAAKNVLLILPEVAFDMASSDPGKLGQANGFLNLLQEILAELPPQIGKKSAQDVASVAIASHSGGYWAAASIATQGGVPIEQIWLLDSLYGSYPSYVQWVKASLPGLKGAANWNHRLFIVYTDGGGTLALSQQLAAETQLLVAADSWLHDTTTSTWKAETYARGLLFKHSALTHHGTTLYYPQKLIETGHFTPIP